MRACGKNVESLRGRDDTLLFFYIFFPFLFYILSLVSHRCGWGRSFNVWNSSFRSKNGELGRSVGIWNRLSAPWTCLFRQLKMAHGANQREPRVLFSVKNDGHQSPRRRLYSSSVRVHTISRRDYPGTLGDLLKPEACLVSSDTRWGCPVASAPIQSLLENAASAWVCWACRFHRALTLPGGLVNKWGRGWREEGCLECVADIPQISARRSKTGASRG